MRWPRRKTCKKHLRKEDKWNGIACGASSYSEDRTDDPEEVDCLGCLRIMGLHTPEKLVCTNTNCDWYRADSYNGCHGYNNKGVRACSQRHNPSKEPCALCGREHTPENAIKERVCRHCRGSWTRHKNLVRRLTNG